MSPRLPALLLGLLVACKPADTVLELHFEHRVGGQELQLAQSYDTRYGKTVTFDHVRYWVSNVTLDGPDGPVDFAEPYWLIEHTPDNTRELIELVVPPGRYDVLTFHVGVDPGPNGSLDLMAGELQPGIGMDWGWDTGYKFLRAEGTFDEAGTSGMFSMHVGTDALYKRFDASLPSLEIRKKERDRLFIQAELEALFPGVELSRTPEILGGTPDSLAGKVASNYGRMFSLASDTDLVPFTASSPNLIPDDADKDIPTDGTPPALAHAVIDPAQLWCDPVPDRPASADRPCMSSFHLGNSPEDLGWLTFVTQAGAPVRAATAGVVEEVRFLAHSDLTHTDQFLVVTRSHADSAFWIEYRNVKDVAVSVGDNVEPGDPLGVAGDHHHTSVGAVSFGVRRQQELVQRLCPTRYASEDVVATWSSALAAAGGSELCEVQSLVCDGEACIAADHFVEAGGDVDAGRRVYISSCASCHGVEGEGGIAPPVCSGPGCVCVDCVDQETLATRIEADMPPEGYCDPDCAANTAAWILYGFVVP